MLGEYDDDDEDDDDEGFMPRKLFFFSFSQFKVIVILYNFNYKTLNGLKNILIQ